MEFSDRSGSKLFWFLITSLRSMLRESYALLFSLCTRLQKLLFDDGSFLNADIHELFLLYSSDIIMEPGIYNWFWSDGISCWSVLKWLSLKRLYALICCICLSKFFIWLMYWDIASNSELTYVAFDDFWFDFCVTSTLTFFVSSCSFVFLCMIINYWFYLFSLFNYFLHLVFNLILNWVPLPISLSQLTVPPMDSMIYLHIERPSPVPPLFLSEFSDSFPKLTNNFCTPSFEIPSPLSMILISYEINFSMLYRPKMSLD